MFIINYRSSLVFQYIKNEVLYEISVLTVKYEIAYVNQFLDQYRIGLVKVCSLRTQKLSFVFNLVLKHVDRLSSYPCG